MAILKVGAGKACMDPTPDMYPIPGQRTDFGLPPMQYEEKYDSCNVRAIALDNGAVKVMLMAFEGTVPSEQEYVDGLAELTGIPAGNIFIVATHNHTAPGTHSPGRSMPQDPAVIAWNERYDKILRDAGRKAAKDAADSMRPARCGYGETLSYTNTNRNLKTLHGYWTEARNLEGYSDKTLAILKFVDMEGNLIAAFLNHATHATCCYMLKDSDGKAKTSGNFTGIACRFVEEHYGNGAVALWTSGAAGDQNPILSHGMQYEWPDGFTSQIQYPDGVGYMQMEYMGRYHGADCVKGIDAITRYRDNVLVNHVQESVWLECRKQKVFDMNFIPKARGGEQGPRTDKYPEGVLPPLNQGPEMVPDEPKELILHLLQIGDISMFFMNCELFSRLGKDVKDASPFKNTVIVTHHRGPRTGYIFDKASADVKVPMAYSGVVPGANDERIVEGERRAFDKLFAQQ